MIPPALLGVEWSSRVKEADPTESMKVNTCKRALRGPKGPLTSEETRSVVTCVRDNFLEDGPSDTPPARGGCAFAGPRKGSRTIRGPLPLLDVKGHEDSLPSLHSRRSGPPEPIFTDL